MKKNNKNKISLESAKNIKAVGLFAVISAFMLLVATYAWFIGTQEVWINEFEVKIASTESLKLSFDGETWKDTLDIASREDLFEKVYTADADLGEVYNGKNTSVNWTVEEKDQPRKGLVPLSTSGVIDPTTSRLVFYEKASFTPTPGGYRLLATKVDNTATRADDLTKPKKYSDQIQKGYVAFDLFIKNISGSVYLPKYDIKNEEAIYLTRDSYVVGKNTEDSATPVNGNTPSTTLGIENSVRIAFAQIGRVNMNDSTKEAITGINCSGNNNEDITKQTGICRVADIWEPNDKAHTDAAKLWYSKSCKKRTGENTYAGPCKNINDAVNTFTINQEILPDSNYVVDIYDGEDYNEYPISNTTEFPNYNISKFKYFTDTDKCVGYSGGIDGSVCARDNTNASKREPLLRLAPNSITKIRIYIYIEGQDVDNIDIAGKAYSIVASFGFTKQRYEEDLFN